MPPCPTPKRLTGVQDLGSTSTSAAASAVVHTRPKRTCSNQFTVSPRIISSSSGSSPIAPSLGKQTWIPHLRRNGHLVCVHDRRLSLCVECKGGSICVHGKQRHWCQECGGRARCPHGKQKSRCKECGGVGMRRCFYVCIFLLNISFAGICKHGRLKWRCKMCNG